MSKVARAVAAVVCGLGSMLAGAGPAHATPGIMCAASAVQIGDVAFVKAGSTDEACHQSSYHGNFDVPPLVEIRAADVQADCYCGHAAGPYASADIAGVAVDLGGGREVQAGGVRAIADATRADYGDDTSAYSSVEELHIGSRTLYPGTRQMTLHIGGSTLWINRRAIERTASHVRVDVIPIGLQVGRNGPIIAIGHAQVSVG